MHTCFLGFSTHAAQNSLPREWGYSLAHSMVPLIGTQWLDLHTSANTIKMVSHRHAEDQHDLDNPSRRLFLGSSRFCEVVTIIAWVMVMMVIYFIYVHMCVCVSVCHVCVGATRGQKRASAPLEPEYHVVVRHPTWVLGTKPGFLEEQQVPLTSGPPISPFPLFKD